MQNNNNNIPVWKNISLAHGTFYFGPHSHEIMVGDNSTTTTLVHENNFFSSFNSAQREIVDDDTIDVQKEKERCARYNYQLKDEINPKRRRLFLGSLLGDDSMEVIRALGTEVYNIFDTVSFIESNFTLNMSRKKWKYCYHQEENEEKIFQWFGPKTKVSVDCYVTSLEGFFGRQSDLSFEYCQREGSMHRWAINGMKPEDIGIISDADETFTRDFLRAMQICDVPEFRPNQDCIRSKVLASSIVLESSPDCVTKDRRWWHPDAILGECVETVGNTSLHPPAKREYATLHGLREKGHGKDGNFSTYWSENGLEEDSGVYPTWTAADMRRESGGSHVIMNDGSPTGYHFHNFFTSAEAIHVKYHTYGHAAVDAMDKPFWDLHEDIKLAVDCANGIITSSLAVIDTNRSKFPLFYLDDDIRLKRHRKWQSIVKEEEEYWRSSANNVTVERYNSTKYLQSES